MKSPILDESPKSGPTQPSEARQVRVGEEFTVTRSANGSTGYQWTLDAHWQRSGIVTLARHHVEPGDPERPGSPGREQWTFRALAAGEVTLRFTHARAWEPSSGSTDELRVTVS
jgi:predicted secreted protein